MCTIAESTLPAQAVTVRIPVRSLTTVDNGLGEKVVLYSPARLYR